MVAKVSPAAYGDYSCIVVDIDGTLANCEHRRVHLDQTPPDWKTFNSLMDRDTPISPILRLVYLCHHSRYKIILCSGREDAYRAVTENWLDHWSIPYEKLYMRPNKDYRSDEIVKSELLDRILADGHNPWFVIDDRKRVVDMWRRRGLLCFQCAEGDF